MCSTGAPFPVVLYQTVSPPLSVAIGIVLFSTRPNSFSLALVSSLFTSTKSCMASELASIKSRKAVITLFFSPRRITCSR